MGKTLGIDIGGSTTKIVGLDNQQIFSSMLIKATDPIASVYGALGKFLNINNLALSNIENISTTGVGSSYITKNLYNIPTRIINEFEATGRGGLFLSKLNKAIVVSMGTGTSMVLANGKQVRHIGGTGIGGGALLGLSNKMLNIRDFHDLIAIADTGNLAQVDLTVGDIYQDIMTELPPYATAANFGKIGDLATKGDLALGIINLVFQTIGMLSIFASQTYDIQDIVLTGNLTNVPQAGKIFDDLARLFPVNFHIPNAAEYATAVGAAIN